jgi:hypothetical protein
MTGKITADPPADWFEGGAPDPESDEFDPMAEAEDARDEANVKRAARLLQRAHDLLLSEFGPAEGWHLLTGWVDQLKPTEVKRGAPRNWGLRDAWYAKQAAKGPKAAVVQEWAERLCIEPVSLDRQLRRLNPEMRAEQEALKKWTALRDKK